MFLKTFNFLSVFSDFFNADIDLIFIILEIKVHRLCDNSIVTNIP